MPIVGIRFRHMLFPSVLFFFYMANKISKQKIINLQSFQDPSAEIILDNLIYKGARGE